MDAELLAQSARMEIAGALIGVLFGIALLVAYWFAVRAVGFAAERKGRSYSAWSLIALFFLVPAAIIVACMRDLDEEEDEDLRPCPACAEWIQPQARLCRFCHSEVSPVAPTG